MCAGGSSLTASPRFTCPIFGCSVALHVQFFTRNFLMLINVWLFDLFWVRIDLSNHWPRQGINNIRFDIIPSQPIGNVPNTRLRVLAAATEIFAAMAPVVVVWAIWPSRISHNFALIRAELVLCHFPFMCLSRPMFLVVSVDQGLVGAFCAQAPPGFVILKRCPGLMEKAFLDPCTGVPLEVSYWDHGSLGLEQISFSDLTNSCLVTENLNKAHFLGGGF